MKGFLNWCHFECQLEFTLTICPLSSLKSIQETYLTPSSPAGRQLARAWLEYRYGVFEEAGAPGSAAHPPHYRAPDGAWKPNVCTNLPAVAANPACDPANLTCPLSLTKDAEEQVAAEYAGDADERARRSVPGGVTSLMALTDDPAVRENLFHQASVDIDILYKASSAPLVPRRPRRRHLWSRRRAALELIY